MGCTLGLRVREASLSPVFQTLGLYLCLWTVLELQGRAATGKICEVGGLGPWNGSPG